MENLTSYGHRWNEIRMCVVSGNHSPMISEVELMQRLKEASIPASRSYIKAYTNGGCLIHPHPGQYQFTIEPVMNGILTNIIDECNARLCHPQSKSITWEESLELLIEANGLKEILTYLKDKYGVQSRIPVVTYDEI